MFEECQAIVSRYIVERRMLYDAGVTNFSKEGGIRGVMDV